MNLAKLDSLKTLQAPPSAYSVYKRIFHLVFAIILTVICINLWLLSNQHARTWYANQAEQLGRSLAGQGAATLSVYLQQSDKPAIARVLMNLNNDPHVLEASVFNYRGQLIDSTRKDHSLLDDYKQHDRFPLVFVENIVFEDKIIGYFRLLLDEQQVMQYHSEYQTKVAEQMIILILLATAAGWVLTRVFYKFRIKLSDKAGTKQDL